MEIGPLVLAAYREWHAARSAWLVTPTDAADHDAATRRYRDAELALALHCAIGIEVAMGDQLDGAA
jgi:hypothetical protein